MSTHAASSSDPLTNVQEPGVVERGTTAKNYTGFSPPADNGLEGRKTNVASTNAPSPANQATKQQLSTLNSANKAGATARTKSAPPSTATASQPKHHIEQNPELAVSEKTAEVASSVSLVHDDAADTLRAHIASLTQFIALYKQGKFEGNWPPELKTEELRAQALNEKLQESTEALMSFPVGVKLPESLHSLRRELVALQGQVKLLPHPEVSPLQAAVIIKQVASTAQELASSIGNIAIAKKNVATAEQPAELQAQIKGIIKQQLQKCEEALTHIPKDHLLPPELRAVKEKLELYHEILQHQEAGTSPEEILSKLPPKLQKLIQLVQLEKKEHTAQTYKQQLTEFFQVNPPTAEDIKQAWQACAMCSLISDRPFELPVIYFGGEVRKYGANFLDNKDPADVIQATPLLKLAFEAELKYRGTYAAVLDVAKYNAERIAQAKQEILDLVQCVGTVCKYPEAKTKAFLDYTNKVFAEVEQAASDNSLKPAEYKALVDQKQEQFQKDYAEYNRGLRELTESVIKDSKSMIPFISRPARAKANKLRDAFRAAHKPFDDAKYKGPRDDNLMTVTNLILDPRVYDVPFGGLKVLKQAQDQLLAKRSQTGLPLLPPQPPHSSPAA